MKTNLKTELKPVARILTTLLAVVAMIGSVQAQAPERGWRFTVQPYLMAPAMDGKATVRGRNAAVDVSRADIIDNLNIGILGYVEAAKGDWAIGLDTNYMNLDATSDQRRTSANVSQLALQPMIFYRVSDNLELLAGARYNSIKLEFESRFPVLDGLQRKKDWADPIVGARITAPVSETTQFSFLANVGGFEVSSDIAVQARAMMSFATSRTMTVDIGYQLFYMKYDNGAQRSRFVYDVLTDGPILGITFRF